MTTEAKLQINSSELGSLWMTYLTLSAWIAVSGVFKDKTIDKTANKIITDDLNDMQNQINAITDIFKSEGAVIPFAFDERDVFKDAPPLYDDIFNIMFVRQFKKLSMGYATLFTSMSYKKEVKDVYKFIHDEGFKHYDVATNYLLEKGVLAKPPYVTMPKKEEYIEDNNYMSGFNIFSDKRSLNTIEVGYISQAIEDNIFGMQLITGFAQVAKESEVKDYFVEGKELAKKIISKLSDVMLQSDIQPSSAWAGKATDSTNQPFSDKLMMYLCSLLSSTSTSFNAIGTSFSMRSDLPLILTKISKDTFDFAKKGGKIMIKHKWMEEPPQMEDRNQLIKSKK